MAFDITDTLKVIETHMAGSGFLRKTIIGEPKAPPIDEVTVAIFLDTVEQVGTTLDGTIEVHTVKARVYIRMLEEPTEGIETKIANALSQARSDLTGDFTLGGKVRAIDVAGIYGTTMRTIYGHIELGRVLFRTADLAIPLIVDDSATFAP